MDYSDLNRKYRQTDARIGGIEAINKGYNMTTKEINDAAADAGIKYPSDDVWTYYFVAQCLNSARSLVDEAVDYEVDDYEEMISQEADSCVPYQTYVLWVIWNECGQEVNAWEDYGMGSIEVDELFKIPQTQIFKYAESIIREHFYIKMS